MKKSIYYWSPCLTKVGTVKSTLNSAVSLAKYSKIYNVKILDVFGEWSNYREYLLKNNVEVENLTFNYYNFLPKHGFLQSRLSYFIICLISCVPLIVFFKRKKPEIFIIHLITALPLLLLNLFNIKSKIILRISGFPKLNFFRKMLWTFSEKKIFAITCPTKDLKKKLLRDNIFTFNKIEVLFDAIININEFLSKKVDKNLKSPKEFEKGYFMTAGRLTKQKNHIYLIREFKKFLKFYPNEKLILVGEGELKNKIKNEILNNNLSNNIKLLDYKDNIYFYMKNSKAFILSSLWEEVGFVIVEAALCNTIIISSDCKNGPKEFLLEGKAGIIFKNNTADQLLYKLKEFKNLEQKDINEKKLLAKKNVKQFTMFRHYLSLNKIIERI